MVGKEGNELVILIAYLCQCTRQASEPRSPNAEGCTSRRYAIEPCADGAYDSR